MFYSFLSSLKSFKRLIIVVSIILPIMFISYVLYFFTNNFSDNSPTITVKDYCNYSGTNYGLEVKKNVNVSGNFYERVIFLDKNNLTGVYNVLHNKHNSCDNTAFVLKTDLDFTKLKQQFVPIGDSHIPFSASFFGNGHTIKIGSIIQTGNDNIGFFSKIVGLKKNIITNFNLKIYKIQGKNYVGGLAGQIENAKIKNVNVKISYLKGRSYVGGIVGKNDGIIENSTIVSDGKISGKYLSVGGIVGENNGVVKNSIIIASFLENLRFNVGGLVDSNNGVIENSFGIIKNIIGKGYVGGIVGENLKGKIKNSSIIADSLKSKKGIAGLIALNNSSIFNIVGIVNNIEGEVVAGGIVGENSNGKVENSSITANNILSENIVGGIVGDNYGIINKNTAMVNLIKGGEYVGGVIGRNFNNISNNTAIIKEIKPNFSWNWHYNITKKQIVGQNKGKIQNTLVKIMKSHRIIKKGYYSNNNKKGNITSFKYKTSFFENNGIKFDGKTLKIKVPKQIIFNPKNFEWGQNLINGLKYSFEK